MADETKIEAPAAAAAEAPAKVVEAVAETAGKAVEAASKAVKAPRAKAPKVAASPKKAKARRTTARRAKRTAKPAAPKIERTKTMNFDATKMFAFDALPGTDKFQALFADAGERSQEIVKKSQKAAEELAEIAKANVEALAEAGRIAAAGARTIGQDALASGRESLEQASAAVKTLVDAKSPTEFFQLQSELARASFDRAVAESSKLTEQLVKLAGEAVQPLSTRASLNAERINDLAA
ncbi:MAG TPA: phasin family protein [Sphingomicrobium sp.]|nr:phasin family protein [Sphingomicrobium sp.]